jgi:hypothetical protein
MMDLSNGNGRELFFNDSSVFISEAQHIIDIIAYKFVKSKSFTFSELSDIKQTIAEELLKKKTKILTQYQGKAQFSTYLSVVIQNICREILRRKRPVFDSVPETMQWEDKSSVSPENEVIINQEVIKLKHAIALYYRQKSKLELCLKLRFRIPLHYSDLQNVSPDFSPEEFSCFLTDIGDYLESSDKKIYAVLIPVLNKSEGKENTADSIRKWTTLKIFELIDFLNGDPPASNYNEETLQILFEKYCNFILSTTIERN